MNKPIINISDIDITNNEFLLVWSYFGLRPNKVALYDTYNLKKVQEIIDLNYIIEERNEIREISPEEDLDSINLKCFLKISDTIFMSYTIMDELSEDSYINGITIYYKNTYEEISELISKIRNCFISISESSVEDLHRFNFLTLGQNGIALERYDPKPLDIDNLELYYNEEVLVSIPKIIEDININTSGLHIIYGERGCGKTSLINYLCLNTNKLIVQIPLNAVDSSINNPEFINQLKKWSNSILVIEDVDTLFDSIYKNSSSFVNNILSIIDGFLAHELNINIIISFNNEKEEDLDEILKESSKNIINVDKLKSEKVSSLSKYLKIKKYPKIDQKLKNVINNKVNKQDTQTVGF